MFITLHFQRIWESTTKKSVPLQHNIVLLSFQRDLIYITMSEELHHAMPQKCVIGCAIFSTGLCSIVFLLQYLNYGEFTRIRYKIVSNQMLKNKYFEEYHYG